MSVITTTMRVVSGKGTPEVLNVEVRLGKTKMDIRMPIMTMALTMTAG